MGSPRLLAKATRGVKYVKNATGLEVYSAKVYRGEGAKFNSYVSDNNKINCFNIFFIHTDVCYM